MNTSVSVNQTSSLVLTCSNSYPGSSIGLACTAFQIFVLLPIQSWVLWLHTSDIRKGGCLAASDIFTVCLCALEIGIIFLMGIVVIVFALNYQQAIIFITFFSGSHMVGRPFMNSLICVERYIAVAHPVIYRNPAFVKHRYIAVGVVCLLILCYGGFVIYVFPGIPFKAYIVCLIISLSVISACSLGVLKILLRPSPGETQREGMDRQKKRAFIIITSILVGISIGYGLDLLLFSLIKNITYDTFCMLLSINMWLTQQVTLMQPFLYLSKLGKFSCIKKGSH